jgi:hypothetical protein
VHASSISFIKYDGVPDDPGRYRRHGGKMILLLLTKSHITFFPLSYFQSLYNRVDLACYDLNFMYDMPQI